MSQTVDCLTIGRCSEQEARLAKDVTQKVPPGGLLRLADLAESVTDAIQAEVRNFQASLELAR